ncbi:PAS domain S-box protein [Rhodobacterales bacterium]|nr:PAS domain S-box protein [Rhodobacterales bacterium]
MVAVGASAGGVEALKTFVSFIPKDTRSSFVILPHLAPDHDSQLGDILGRAAALPVLEADQNMPVEAGHIYVLTPARYLALVDHGLFVEAPAEPRGLRMPIDYFMRSLAKTAGSLAVGVVLSGTGSDGTIGLREIKGAGGVALAQSPETCLYDGMPNAAIEAGVVDKVGDLEDLCKTITELADRLQQAPESNDFPKKDLNDVLALLKARTGHDFTAYKGGTVTRRVRRRMNLLRFDTLADYLAYLRENSDELRQLFDDMLINVTCFFRDTTVWDNVRYKIIAPLIENAAAKRDPIRIWVPACSSGEEAFTIAILMEEECSKQQQPCDWQIFATDLDADAVAHGREGYYRESIADDVNAERLQRFFKRENAGYRINKNLRDKVVFAHQNVLTDPPFSRLDFISCRNLLIYLDNKHQEQLLETFHFALKEECFLLLGTSETTGPRKHEFQALESKDHIFVRKPGRSIARLSPRADAALAGGLGKPAFSSSQERQRDLADKVRRSLLERYAPAAVTVQETGEIVYFHGPVRRFVDHPEGAPSNSIFDILPPALRSRAREAIKATKAAGNDTFRRSAKVRFADRDATVNLECALIRDMEQILFVLTFIEVEDHEAPESPTAGGETDQVVQLESELAILREDLQTTVEELETSNEELKASHEEAVAANEELQSANEELETSREELQSLNEELITVNNQLEEKIAEVEKSTDDMRNLLTSTKLPVLFLDPELKISGFTPSLADLVETRDGDIGRPVTELAFKVDDTRLIEDALSTLADLTPAEMQIRSSTGETYLRRIQPYRTSDQRINGVVVTYADISQQADIAEMLAGRERQQRIIAEVGQTALNARDLTVFLNELCASLRVALNCDFAKVLRFDAQDDRLDLVAGAGWTSGAVGKTTVPSGVKSQGGYTLKQDSPILVTDIAEERRFDAPQLLTDNGVRSGVSCLIEVGGKRWGVLGLHDRDPNHFLREDLTIIQAAANVAASTIMQIERESHIARESLISSLALKAADLGVWQYDVWSQDVVLHNRLKEMIGIEQSRSTAPLSDLLSMVLPDDRERFESALQKTCEDGTPLKEEFRLIRPDGGEIWMVARGERMRENGRLTVLGVNTDITERKASEEQNRFVMRELDHRVKNVLAIILSIAKITGRTATDFPSFIESFENRLQAMARTHSLLAEGRWRGAGLRSLVGDELAHSESGRNVTIDGPDVALSPTAAQAFSMALHELCTNAMKYGAFSVADGELLVSWQRINASDREEKLLFEWKERKGPEVKKPETKGYGSTVLERIFSTQLSARTQIDFAPEGLVVTSEIPIQQLSTGAAIKEAKTTPLPPQIDLSPLVDARVLVLDDEWLIAEQHAQYLLGAGASVLGPFNTIDQARKPLGVEKIDCAVLDYNIGGQSVEDLIPQFRAKGIPVLIVSGYGSAVEFSERTGGLHYLAKPVSPAAMLGRVALLIEEQRGDDAP